VTNKDSGKSLIRRGYTLKTSSVGIIPSSPTKLLIAFTTIYKTISLPIDKSLSVRILKARRNSI
jgi:hypothetical protein